MQEKRTVHPGAEECLICGAPLEYLAQDARMTCAVCGESHPSKARCIRGHYVCDRCHTAGLDAAVALCLADTRSDPLDILEDLMSLEACHMHGPEHHVLVGAALLTACANAGGAVDLPRALAEMVRRGRQVPGGACGFWGACGAGVSTGMYVSIVTGATPLAGEPWGLANRMTARALRAIGEIGGPRCCKRNASLAVLAAADFTREALGVPLEARARACSRSGKNSQCIGERCPFHKDAAK